MNQPAEREPISAPDPVVITGVGAVTPLGTGAELVYKRWCAGELAIEDGVARCTDFDPGQFLSRREFRGMDRFGQLAVVAADEALTQAGWTRGDLPYPPNRIGCVIASAMGGVQTLFGQMDHFRTNPRRVLPFTTSMVMPSAAAGQITLRWGLRGESCAVCAACASGTHAFGTAMRMLADGSLDAVVAGGADAAICDEMIHAFSLLGALSQRGVARPFDRRRDGFVLGEGAGVMLLERARAARRRSAVILGEVAGFGASSDAHHMCAPNPTGEPASDAIKGALSSAGVKPSEVSYVNCHGSGSPIGDVAETRALKSALGDHAWRVPVSSLKSSVGHLMGGAGTVEAIATLFALREGFAPPTLGLEEPGDELDLNYVPGVAQPIPAPSTGDRVGVSSSFGLGGSNAVVVLRVA
jgi:3-oxoacyl-[acyl-carrier-protein] synthase II